MKPSVISMLSLCICSVLLFITCEKEPSDIIPVNKDYLLCRVLKEGKLHQEYIYNDNKKLVRVNSYHDDSVYWFDIYKYNSAGKVIMKEYSDDYYETYEYDDKNNPRYNWDLPTDIIQYNNPVRYINQNALSCMMPPNYEYQYEYNSDGYPVMEIRNWVGSEVYDTFYYEYLK